MSGDVVRVIADAGATWRIAVLRGGADPVEVASWTVARADVLPDGDLWWVRDDDHAVAVEAERSPDRVRVAVRVGKRTWTVDLATGAVSDHRPAAPAEPDDDAGGGSWLPAAWDWRHGGEARLVRRPERGTHRIAVRPGCEVVIEGEVSHDGGSMPGSVGLTSAFFPHGTTREEMDAAIAEIRADERRDAHGERASRVAIVRDGVATIVHEERARPLDGTTRVHWPPVVGTDGVLLRRAGHVRTHDAGDALDALPPWFVGTDGVLREIPAPLGNGPLCQLPGPRFLLPGEELAWWDDDSEDLHVLDLAGDLEPLLVGGEPVSPRTIAGVIAPDVRDEPRPEFDEGWVPAAARFDAPSGYVWLLLDEGLNPAPEGDPRGRWLIASLALTAAGPPMALVARGRTSMARHEIPLL